MELIGYFFAVLMGLSLGLIGGGGSILTVPILVYLFKVDTVLATAYSLFIVGSVSMIGSLSHARMGNIDWRTALVFGTPSLVMVFLIRRFVIPALPDQLFHIGTTSISTSHGLMLFFALLMLASARSMIRKPPTISPTGEGTKSNTTLILLLGALEGSISGMVGAGGGFLIIPILVLLAKLPMKQAVGTSLAIIAVKSLIGFTGDLSSGAPIDWSLLLTFAVIAIVGILIGSRLSTHISNQRLKPVFGWFVLVMGLYIIGRELAQLT